jgi:hypothetical protein
MREKRGERKEKRGTNKKDKERERGREREQELMNDVGLGCLGLF